MEYQEKVSLMSDVIKSNEGWAKAIAEVITLRNHLKASQETALDYHRRWQEAEAKMVPMEEARNAAMKASGASQADVKLLREAAQALIDKMRKVEDSPEYSVVWMTAHLENGPYSGPNWRVEFESLCSAIAATAPKEGE